MKTRLQPRKTKRVHIVERTPPGSSGILLFLPYLVIAGVVLAVAIARIKLLSVPLERDEGEYSYLGQLILHGTPPYGVAANMKLPGTYLAYALFMAIFGQTTTAIHLGLLLVDAASAVLVYAIAKRLFPGYVAYWRTSPVALAAAAAFSVLSIGRGVLGLWAHATHFVVVCALAATWLLLRWTKSRNPGTLFASGLFYGLAFLMKQPGALFAVFGAGWILWTYRNAARNSPTPAGALPPNRTAIVLRILANLLLFSTAAALPLAIVCIWLWRAGVFERFWFWTVTYGRLYGSMMSLSDAWRAFWYTAPGVVLDAWPIWLLAAAGALFQLRAPWRHGTAVFLFAFLAIACASVCPGFYFRQHYFVPLLPAIALLVGAFLCDLPAVNGILGRTARIWIVAGAMAFVVVSQQHLLFELSPPEASKFVYPTSPFVEAIQVGKYIKSHSSKDAKVAILGSEPEILFYADRRSATPYIYVYSMMELHPYAARMQDEFIHDIEQSAPEYVVLVNNESSWILRAGSTERIMDWWPAYGDAHYQQVGLADMLPDGTNYYWDQAATHTAPKAHFYLAVLKRKRT